MNYNELKQEYSKNLKLGLGISLAAHIIAVVLILILNPGDNKNKSTYDGREVTYIDIMPTNERQLPPSIVEERGGGGGSRKVSGNPVPVKVVKKEVEFDQKAGAKGDSTKTGNGGSGYGSGSGAGSAPNPIRTFRKSDYLIAVDMQPEPIGGYAAINKKAGYPDAARKNSIKGKVFIQAYIDENGEVVFAEVLKGLGYGCDEAALRAVKTTRFKPGKQYGRYVKVQMSVSVNFF